jgi:hypothetical protein
MKIEQLAECVWPEGLFRTGQIMTGQRDSAGVRRQLDRWVKSGRVLRLRRGVYLLQKPYASADPHPFSVANALKKASYVSLQSALAHHGMIPEYVPMTTSVTTRRPEELNTPLGRFQFRHVGPSRFFGFSEVKLNRNQAALMASPQKALADLLYLTPRSDDEDYLRELRVEPPEGFDLDVLGVTVERYRSAKVERAVRRLLHQWQEDV